MRGRGRVHVGLFTVEVPAPAAAGLSARSRNAAVRLRPPEPCHGSSPIRDESPLSRAAASHTGGQIFRPSAGAGVQSVMAIQQGAVMNHLKKLTVAVLAVASLSGCATAPMADQPTADAAPAAGQQVSRPLPSYGKMGGYRFRRFVSVTIASS